jgi:MOSC domain-containing protein YiiM
MAASLIGIVLSPAGTMLPGNVSAGVLEVGRGLVGDRYYRGTGTFSKVPLQPDAEITLIELEEIDRFNALQTASFPIGAFRRNLVTQDIRLNDLVGKRFVVGDALLEGKRLCEPCSHLAKLTTPTIVADMAHRAGLRARILRGGAIRVGDAVARL